MQITIDLPEDLTQSLLDRANQREISLEVLILQSLHQIVRTTQDQAFSWPDLVLAYQGIPDFPEFESYRNELLPPRALELF